MDVRAVVFDFFGTLTPGRTPEAQAAARAAQATALGVDPEAFDQLLSETHVDRFRGRSGGVEEALRWAADRLGAPVTRAAAAGAARVRIATERQFATPRDEAVGVLGELRSASLRIGVVSDCTAELPLCWDDLPVARLVDAVVFSCVTGHVKPEPENYLTCAVELGVDPAACVYVGDGGSDELAGAAQVGMRPVLLDVVDERGGVVYGRVDWTGRSITGLAEVPGVVGVR